MIVAPALLLASTAAYSLGDGFNEDEIGGAVQVYAIVGFGLVMVGIARLVEPHSPRLALAIVGTGLLGMAGGVTYGLDSIHFAYTGMTGEDMGAAGPMVLQGLGIFFPVSSFIAGLALIVTCRQPRWSGYLLLPAAILFPLSRIPSIEPLGLVADGLFVLALWPLGWALIGGREAASERTTPAPQASPQQV